MDVSQAACSHDKLKNENLNSWPSLFDTADPGTDSYWLHPPQQEATKKLAAHTSYNSCGQSRSGSGASGDPCLDSGGINNWQDNLLEPVQLKQPPICLSRGNSTQSNQLSGMESFTTTREQQLSGPAEAGSGSWRAVMLNDALARAAARICEEEGKDLDQAVEFIRQEQQRKQQEQPKELQYQQEPLSVLPVPAVRQISQSNLQDSSTSDTAPSSPQPTGSGTSQAAPASPTFGGDKSTARCSLDGGEGGVAGSSKPIMPTVELKVACGDMIGTLLVHRAKIIIGEGTNEVKEVSPTEFERLGGRSATKKWKQSIRLVQEDGELGRPVGEWYVMQGLEQPKKARESMLNPPGSARSVSPPLERQHGSGHKAVQKRPMRAAARHVSAHIAAEAAGSPEGGLEEPVQAHERAVTRKGAHSRAAKAAANAVVAVAAPLLPSLPDNIGSGTGKHVHHLTGAVPAATSSSGQVPEPMMLPQQQQQFTMQNATSMLSPATSNGGVFEDPAEALDAAALGDYCMPPGAAAAAAAISAVDAHSGPLLVPVHAPQPLPGDASQAVIEMTAYLEGRRSVPPWRLLPAGQRPLLGQYLVPLRQLFVLVMRAGGYGSVQDDLLMWQDFAGQLGLPAWPCPSIPDPLRALQHIYKDYLLRFESRFKMPDAPAAGAHHSPTLSTATQYAGGQQQQQQPVSAAAVDSSFNSQQQLQMQGSLPPDAAAALEGSLSGDLLEFLSELIPDNGAEMPAEAAASGVLLKQPSLPGILSTPGVHAADGARSGAVMRQHPEMGIIQQRQQVQQLHQQVEQLRQQQQQRFAPVRSADDSGAARMKRPPPLIRCGDSDVVSLMDQSELARLLHDYEQHQQSQHAAMLRQQQVAAGMQGRMPPSGRATSSQLAAAVVGAVDRNQSQDLQAIMQQFWQQQGQSQGQQLGSLQTQQQQQQQQAALGTELEAQPAEEEMSGMLEALQLAADGSALLQPSSAQQPQHTGVLASSSSSGCNLPGEQLLLMSGDSSNHLMPTRAHLLAHGSVGAHLIGLIPTSGTQQGAGSFTGGQQWQQQQQQGDHGMPPPANVAMQGLRPRQSSAPDAAVGAYQDMQQQQQGDASLLGFGGGLMRLSTPNSTLIGSVLDLPVTHNPGQGWMDISSQALPHTVSNDFKSMTVELIGTDGAQAGPSADDLAAVLRMW